MRTAKLARAAMLLVLLLGGCSSLRPGEPQPTFYALDSMPAHSPPSGATMKTNHGNAPTLLINMPQAAAGYDSQRMAYLRRPYELEYFARSQWVDTPARMLQPLIAAAVERRGKFGAVVQMPISVTGDYRLEAELTRLQQEFLTRPSRVRVTLRATLTDMATRRVVAWREFDAVAPADSDDPYGGVVAANRAVHDVLEDLAAFCADAAGNRLQEAADGRP